jgi:exopolyphosphatase/pppGpp-phosphohydrolase
MAAQTAAPPVQKRSSICAIDMGSNTFRRIVGSFESERYEQTTLEKKTLGVGDDVTRNGQISEAKLTEIEQTLAAFKTSCETEGIRSVVAIGTAAFREAPNGAKVVEIASALGIPAEIASERRESELAYLVASLGHDGYAVIDAGSRSIELVSRSGGSLQYIVVSLGYRLAYDTYFAASGDPRAASSAFVTQLKKEASNALFMKGKKQLIGVEFGDMVSVLFDASAVEGRTFPLQTLTEKLHEIVSMSAEEFRSLKQKKDIDRALPRLVVAIALAEEFNYSQIRLTEREVGAGLIIEAGLKGGVR